jgi:hypothetical protein
MNLMFRGTLVAALCASRIASAAISGDDPVPPESTQVAGKSLRLNGTGLGQRFVFKVYAISLYLPEPRHTVEAVLGCDGPSRISILLLRDVSSREFAKAIAESVASRSDEPSIEMGTEAVVEVGVAIAAQPQGLQKGDRLTIDWVPGVGTVVELNQRALIRPNADRSSYTALLKVWLGAKPADAELKSKLLGSSM